MGKTTIEWASHTWNPYTWACRKVSPGCANCYAEFLAERRNGPGAFNRAPQWRGARAMQEIRRMPRGAVVFVNSMSDTYHEQARLTWIHSIHNIAAYLRPDVTFLLLTKRPERALGLARYLAYPPNLWVGTSVENADYLWRLDYLLRIPAAGHFVSAEPLLGPLPGLLPYVAKSFAGTDSYGDRVEMRLSLKRRLRWVIVGAESGAKRRPFDKAWARDIRDMCGRAGVAYMFKQGSAYMSGQDRLLDGRTWDETPFTPRAQAVPAVPMPILPVQMGLWGER
jgi:protein gp37